MDSERITAARAALLSAALGALAPVLWYLVYRMLGPTQIDWIYAMPLDKVLIVVWPTSIFLIGDPTNQNYALQAFSAFSNVVFYTIVGSLVWLGLRRSRWILLLPVAIVAGTWWWVLSL